MTTLPADPATLGELQEVLAAVGLGAPREVLPLGGTATAKWSVVTAEGRWCVRRRPDEFADAVSTAFDHAVLRRLDAAGLPVPAPRAAADGQTAVRRESGTYEVLRWLDGKVFTPDDRRRLPHIGRTLAEFHRALQGDFPPGKEGRLREDHPRLMRPYLDGLRALATSDAQRRGLDRIDYELDRVHHTLDRLYWPRLPRAVIHGDFHIGNVRFQGPSVVAIYDFDYAAVQARARDVCDALVSFASRRAEKRVNPDDVRSLTQPFELQRKPAVALLTAYHEAHPLIGREWEAMAWLIRSRWIQMRLRGSRKLPAAQRVDYVLDRFFDVIEGLEHSGSRFFSLLREECAGECDDDGCDDEYDEGLDADEGADGGQP